MKKLLGLLLCLTTSAWGAVYQNSFVTDPIANPLLITTPELAKFLSNPFQKDANGGGFMLTNVSTVNVNGAGIGHLIVNDTNSGGFGDFFNTGSNLTVNVASTNSGGTLQTNAFTFTGAGNQTNGGNLDLLGGKLNLDGTVSSTIFFNSIGNDWTAQGGSANFTLNDVTHSLNVASFSDTVLILSGGLTVGTGNIDLTGQSIFDGTGRFTSVAGTTSIASNTLVIVSNTYPVVNWGDYGNSSIRSWLSNGTALYFILTNSLAGTATTNLIVPPATGGGTVGVSNSIPLTIVAAADTTNIWLNATQAQTFTFFITNNTLVNITNVAANVADGERRFLHVIENAVGTYNLFTTSSVVKFGQETTGFNMKTNAGTGNWVAFVYDANSNVWDCVSSITGYGP